MIKQTSSTPSSETESQVLSAGKTFQRSAVATFIAASMATSSFVALAQQDADATSQDTADTQQELDLEEVVVKGFRRSLQNSFAMKEGSDSIVEVVTAEDIGKLPDVSIAESLARLPGLASQRLNGRGQVISVRGLSPDFSTALFNGREQVSVGDNRGVEFDQYPSELLSGVVVYKTPDASLLGQGLAGTSDLQSVRPLSVNDRTLAVNARYILTDDSLNPDGEDDGYRVNVTYIDKFMDDTVGVAIGFAHLDNPSQGTEFRGWGYPDVNGDLVLGGHDSLVRSSVLERTSLMAVVQYEPHEDVSHAFDLYLSKFEETDLLRGVEGGLQWSGASLQPNTTVDNGFITDGTYTGVKYVVRNDVESRDADMFNLGWNTQWRFTEDWAFELDLSHSSVDRDDQILESYTGLGPSDQGYVDVANFNVSGAGAVFAGPAVNYGDASQFSITDPLGWGGGAPEGQQVGYLNQPTIEDTLNQVTLAFENQREGVINSMEFGVNFKNREKQKIADEFILDIPGNSRDNPIRTLARPASIGSADLSFLGLGSLAAYDPRAILNSGGYALLRNSSADVSEKSWLVDEDVVTAYAKFGIDAEMGGKPLTGNFGLQVVYTDQESRAVGADAGNGVIQVPLSGGQDFTEVLPSLNLSWHIQEGQQLRLGLARTMARPRMDEMRASTKFSYDSSLALSSDLNLSPWSGSGGNPELDPWIADSLDLSYEWYFADRAGYFAAAYFYKDLDSYVFTTNELFDFSPLLPVIGGQTPVLTQGFVSRPVNGQGGTIEGFELALTLTGEMVSDSLSGWGVSFNYTNTDSEIKANPDDADFITLPGLSDDVWNATLFYENDAGFSARVSARYRSEFLGELQGFGAGREFRLVDEETIVDAQLSYEIQEGNYAGLTFYLQGNNLTDEPFTTFNSEDDFRQVINYEEYGPTYLIGASFKF
ncbi:MAG: TonB-dependent receptor [Pseudomonadota bacterium]